MLHRNLKIKESFEGKERSERNDNIHDETKEFKALNTVVWFILLYMVQIAKHIVQTNIWLCSRVLN